MKVAIIGAGTAGLSCAIELEKHGIYPVIFERNHFIGEYNPHVSAFLNLICRPVKDPIVYINKTLGIDLKPLNPLRKVIHYSPNNQTVVKGPVGYFMVRGREDFSVKNQMFRQLRKPMIQFECFVNPEDIEKEFDYVVVADGHWTVPERYGIWQETLRAWLKGAIFEGDFEDDTLQMWLDNELTKGVYIYSAPYGKNKAVIAHVVQNIEHHELESYWNRFLTSRNILGKYNMVESWELPHHAGFVTTNRVGNTYFIGAAGGGVEPFLGFGQFTAVYTGVMAARSIAYGTDINPMLSLIRKKSSELNRLRPLLNAATNRDFDRFLTIMKTPGLRSLIYNTNIDIIKYIALGLKMISGNTKQYEP